jgi:hypothetical protein
MAGLGRKTFSPGDVLTSSDVQGYLMDQAVMVFSGTAARTSAIPSPSAGMVAYSTATSLQVYDGSAWVDLSTGYGVATGGASSTAISVGGTAYTLLTFTADSTLTVTKSGLFDVLMFGGGAGGAGGQNGTTRAGGGGGAGAKLQATVYLTANQAITVGAGGAGGAADTNGTSGSLSSVGTILNILGGGAGVSDGPVNFEGRSLGTGGGAQGQTGRGAGVTLLGTNFGFNGGAGVNNGGGGGGGGTTAVGANAVTTTGGAGGAGFDVGAFISGSLFKGGGGGGGGSTAGGAGGSSVGGAGSTTTGSAAAANTASGGGGGNGNNAGGAGGSAVIYVRFRT